MIAALIIIACVILFFGFARIEKRAQKDFGDRMEKAFGKDWDL